jgi:hypothetical protein
VERPPELTLELAAEFLRRRRATNASFEPLGVAQGWSPTSYAKAVKSLQAIGYDYIALGGMVPLKTVEVEACLSAIEDLADRVGRAAGRSRLSRVRLRALM